ncbi:hypothetical protein [Bacillus suaedae]|uniref:Uncharacterized protein n=1 Tax=Halalkalibacter suaedae TaxID=2822140 RepID=A0A940X0C5_9BACI|nr:hypothetical protein [Bacillus suaedae]MBP3952536.1 hypothetical protein [Bacillus suaedae]
MNKDGLVALREVSRDEFMDLAQNGARELFELGQYKVFDGSKGEELNHFVYYMGTHNCYLIDIETCYELVTAFYCGGDKPSILENLNKIAASIK